MINNVVIQGNLVADPKVKIFPSDKTKLTFSIACSNGIGDKQKTVFIDVVFWGKAAVFLNDTAAKGDNIIVTGSLNVESWEDSQGGKHKNYCVLAREFSLQSRRKRDQYPKPQNEPTPQPQVEIYSNEADSDYPF